MRSKKNDVQYIYVLSCELILLTRQIKKCLEILTVVRLADGWQKVGRRLADGWPTVIFI